MFHAELAMRKGLRRKGEAGKSNPHDEIVREERAGGSETGRRQQICVEGDKWTAVPGEPSKSDSPEADACSANASHAMDAESVGREAQSELWAPASQVPSIGDAGLPTGCDQRCDAMKKHRPGKESTPAKSCAVSLLLHGGAEPKKRHERLGEPGAENADVSCELEDDAPARTDSQTIEGAHSSVSSGCPN